MDLSKEYNLYRQNYCGCVFSQQEYINRIKNKKIYSIKKVVFYRFNKKHVYTNLKMLEVVFINYKVFLHIDSTVRVIFYFIAFKHSQ